ncbi:MAG: MFS transporter [Acetobacteraceae bacterium]
MADVSPKLRRMQWVAVVLCTLAIALNYIDRSTLAIGNLKIREEFAITAAGIGALQSAWALAFAFSQLPVGLMVDRIGSRRLLGWALVLWSAAQAAGGLLTGYMNFLLSRVFLGVFESPAFPASVRTVANFFHPKDRGRPTGLYTIGGDIGRLIGTPLLTALLLAFGWRTMFVAMGAVGLLGAVGWFALYRDPDLHKLDPADRAYLAANKVGERSPVTIGSWRRLFEFRSMWGMILGAFCSGYAIWMYGTWLPGYLEMQHHVSIARTGLLAMIPLACSIVGSLIGGYVTDRLAHGGMDLVASRKLPAGFGYVASAAFCAGAAYASELGMALTCISASMFFLAFAQSGKWTLITAIAPQSYSASVASIQNFGSYIGGTASPLITGLVVDATGSFALALWIGAGVMIAGALLYTIVVRDPIPLDGLARDVALPRLAVPGGD